MAKSKIEWTDEVWNPVTGCTKVSQGCKNCYAKRLHDQRHKAYLEGAKLPEQYSSPFEDVRVHLNRLPIPIKWKRPRKIFVNSMSDLFHEDVTDEFIARVFAIMFLCWKDDKPATGQHIFQILTKRPERFSIFNNNVFYDLVADYADEYYDKHIRGLSASLFYSDEVKSCFPFDSVWLGVSVEDQKSAEERIPLLLQTPAAVRFISAEPLLSIIDLGIVNRKLSEMGVNCSGRSTGLDWVICGGESGKNARPMHPDWARSLRDQCKAANIPFFFKQWGEYCFPDQTEYEFYDKELGDGCTPDNAPYKIGKKKAGRLLDGKEYNEMPEV